MVWTVRVIHILIHGVSSIVFKEFFDFPVVLLNANGKFEIFFGDRVPILFTALVKLNCRFGTGEGAYLVDHHDSKKIGDGSKE